MGNMKMILAAFILSSCLLIGQTDAREEINFDFAWRFHLGDLQQFLNCNNSAFPHNLSNVECKGLKSNTANTSDSCRDACCTDSSCAIWQYASTKGCWIGTSDDCSSKQSIWVGGGRDLPVPPLPPAKTGPYSRNYDDSSWELVDVPHDGIITGNYSETNGPEKQAYLPKNVTFYRKHFNLPDDWKGLSIWVYFEGVFRASTVFLNGQQLSYHDSGYTSFFVRLDTADEVFYGDGVENDNAIVVRAAPDGESGWWYEGCGIYRHVKLVASSNVHFTPEGIYGASNVTGKIVANSDKDKTKGMYAEQVNFYFESTVVNDMKSNADVTVSYVLYDEDGKSISTTKSSSVKVAPNTNTTVKAQTASSNVQLWSNLRPYLYTLVTTLMTGTTIMDTVNVSIGVRHTKWDPDTGFYLNGQPFVWRGFNNHNNFAGVGMAVPDRVNLFRGQSMRAVGANAWRMSHNPPIPIMLDILDRLGIVVWDENREFGYDNIWIMNQRDMVRRDRNHPSIMAWSFCNEGGCDPSTQKSAGEAFRSVSYAEDAFRPVTANMNGKIGGDLSVIIDIQGFSHRDGSVFDSYHKQFPKKPLIGSECCSCRTQRGEYATDSGKKLFGNFNADCNKAETDNQLTRSFVAGCMVWTLFDYYGEPTPYKWPHVSSSFGSIDLAGFAKASAYWYRTYWLYEKQRVQATDVTYNPPSLVNPGMAPSQDNSSNPYFVYIVHHWDPMDNGDSRTVQVYSNGANIDLYINGKKQGTASTSQGWANFENVKYSSGNITAVALDSSNKKVASITKLTAGKAAKVSAGIDVPSQATGTGSALVLDGQDTGMIHAAILDSNGNLVNDASHNVTFKIVSGPGRIVGVGNGDPQCHEPNQVSWRSAYHGLSRALIQVTKDQASSPLHRKRLIQIDRDGGIRTSIVPPGYEEPLDDGIVVEVSVDGLGSSQVTIPVSTDPDKDGVLSVARHWNM